MVAVNVEGLNRTKNDIVMDSVKDLFNVSIYTRIYLNINTVL